MSMPSIMDAEAGLARGLFFGLMFAVPLWLAICAVALLLWG